MREKKVIDELFHKDWIMDTLLGMERVIVSLKDTILKLQHESRHGRKEK